MQNKLLLSILLLLTAMPLAAQRAHSPRTEAMQTITRTRAEAIVRFLADDALQGREAGRQGSRIAARYLASELQEAGIRPLLGDSYFQPFEACARERQQPARRWQVHPDSIALFKTLPAHRSLHMANVLGVIPGQRADEYVVVGAHFDHLGTDPTLEGDAIYNGADDNASGVSAVLQIARAFMASGQQPLRTIVIAFWDGEELGLLGSEAFLQSCPFAKDIKGYLNFDMIGRNHREDHPRHVVYFYTASHPAFGQWLRRDIAQQGFRLEPDYRAWERPVGGSDNSSFARRDTPIIWYHTDGHPDYHQPSDHPDRLNWEKLTDISRAAFLNAWDLANEESY